MPQKKTVAAYFTSLKVENVKCFGEVQLLDLTDENGNLAQWTLLLGNNGVGKTTLLQCLGWMRPVLVKESEIGASDPFIFKEGFLGAALSYEENDVLVGLLRIGSKLEFEIAAEVYQGSDLKFGSIPTGKRITTYVKSTFKRDKSLDDFDLKEIDIKTKLQGEFWEPLIIAYGANRWMGLLNASNPELSEPIANHLSYYTELYDVEQKLVLYHTAANEKKLQRIESGKEGKEPESIEERMLKAFKSVLVEILPLGDSKHTDNIVVSAPRYIKGGIEDGDVKIKIHNNPIPFSGLSLGYRTTSAWVLDLVWRLFERYPNSKNPIEEPSIVLIDEIDLHLHPRWQIEIMWDLAKIFKRTQFIATAHSPLMVQSMPNANFAVIQEVAENEVKIENEPDKVQGWRLDQILNSQYFDINFSNSPEATQLFKDRNTLLLKSKRTAAEEKHLEEIEKRILAVGETVVWEDREAIELLREAVTLAKKYESKK